MSDHTTSIIVTPDGVRANYQTTLLTHEEAKLLRDYKRFLNRRRLKEVLYCVACYEQNLSHGCEAYVTDGKIGIKCRCQFRWYQGATL